MKTLKYILLSVLAVAGLTACEPDGEIITTSGAEPIFLSGSGDAVLTLDDKTSTALLLYWTDNGTLTTNNPDVQVPPYAIENTLQFSATESFNEVVEQLIGYGIRTMQFSVEELNSIAGRVGLEGGIASPLYIRIKSELAANMPVQYSNTYKISVTPYTLDMTRGIILNTNLEDTGCTLASPNKDGIYSGFLGASSWYNFWLQEGNGIIWGNDGVSGTPFMISSEDTHWNFWYPGVEGCYYTVVNTQRLEWSALHVSALHVTGDAEGDMTYQRKENKWVLTFNAKQAGNAVIKIYGEGEQYNISTGTDDTAAIPTTVGFGQSGDRLTWGESTDITVSIPSAGEATMILDLSAPFKWTCTVEAGGQSEKPVVYPELWAVGIDDGMSGGWNFDQRILLTNEDELTYGGVCQVNSLWGYRLFPEKDMWDGAYGYESGDALEGKLLKDTDANIPAPEPGIYILEASLSAMTYKVIAVESVQITGICDNWDMLPMNKTEETGVYTVDIDVNASTPWGYKILLNNSWDTYLGGTTDQLIYKGANIEFDDSYIGSTCTFTVDICKGTITIAKK